MTGPLPDLYETRFDQREALAKDAMWREIVRYLDRYIDDTAPVLDVACDRGHFIRSVRSVERWATDIRDVGGGLAPEINFVQASGLDLANVLPNAHFGTIFMSNYLEHLASSDDVVEQLRVAYQLLRPGGRLIVLQPNIRLTGQRYWDFIDHKVALTDVSLLEAAALAKLTTEEVVVRFLPYSTKGRLPTRPALVRLYLRVRPVWRLMGKQTLYVGRRSA